VSRLYALYSGSSGNCYYCGTSSEGILIDAGVSCKKIFTALERCNIPTNAVKGIIITHEHSDHVNGLKVTASKLNIPVFASDGTVTELKKNICCDNIKLNKLENEVELAEMKIKHFSVSHDAVDPVGYRIKMNDGKTIVIATDLGIINDDVKNNIMDSDFIVLESNHDRVMLDNGPYPYYLKARIRSDHGHLSNIACSEVLPELVKNGTRRILLAHLSIQNNTPVKAYNESYKKIAKQGYIINRDFTLDVAPKDNITGKGFII
jgi:phosphoribosyl 1,2-cyclic phosphodiesterase